jgi:hypothetical protein
MIGRDGELREPCQFGDDVFCEPFAEIGFHAVGADKWADQDRWRVRARSLGADPRSRAVGSVNKRVDCHGSGNVLELKLTAIFEGQLQPSADLLMHFCRKANASGGCDLFKACSHVHTVAEHVSVAVDDNIAEIYAHSKQQTGRRSLGACEIGLNSHATPDRFDGAGEFRDDTVAGVLYNAPSCR